MLFSFEYCQPLGAGAFRGAFTTNVAPQCRAFSRALEIEKLKAPLFRGPEGAGDTNDWCITFMALTGLTEQNRTKRYILIYFSLTDIDDFISKTLINGYIHLF